ncbi:MAG: hypothetical protein ACW9W4_05815 [Candidatus Nitrosopumilus sp. bin_7KS]
MKTKQALPAMIALVAIMAVAFSPMALAVNADSNIATTTNVAGVSADASISTSVAAERPVDTVVRPQVQFDGTTSGWAIIAGQAHEAKIAIDGKAVRNDNGIWKVSSDAEITAADRHATLELKGKAINGKIKLHGTGTLDSGESFRIILRGHYTPVYDEQGTFVMAFTAAKIHSAENGIHMPLIQSGLVNVEAVNPSTDDYEKFVDEFTVQ